MMTAPFFNYHTHTKYCDGTSYPYEYVEQAIQKKFKYLGFSAHAPLNIKYDWTITKEKIKIYCNDINSIKNNNKLQILLGLEADYAPYISYDFNFLKNIYNLDYIIGSVHLVLAPDKQNYWFIDSNEKNFIEGLSILFKNDIKKAVTTFYEQTSEMIINEKPDIIGHLDKIIMNNKERFFKTDEKWYRQLVMQTLDVIKPDGPIVELNVRGLYKKRINSSFPEIWIVKECKKRNIKMTVSSDAHMPSEISTLLAEGINILKYCGYDKIYYLTKLGIKETNI